MRLLRDGVVSVMRNINIFRYFLLFIAAFIGALLLGMGDAAAGPFTLKTAAGCGKGGIGDIFCNTTKSVQEAPGLLSGLAYLFGIVMGVWGISKLYEHVQNPQQTPIWDSLKRFLAGGCFFALPMVIEVVRNTMATDAASTFGMTGFTGKTSGAGLDAMVTALMRDVWQPFLGNALPAFCYLAGIVLVLIGINRLVKSSQEGPRGPGGFGTIMTFLAAGALFSADSMMEAWSVSLFTSDTVTTQAALQYTAGTSKVEQDHVHAVISAIIAFMAILGWISFIRGWFILRDVAEGNQQASLMAGFTHLFGGALAVNLGPLLNHVQATLGLGAYGVNFG